MARELFEKKHTEEIKSNDFLPETNKTLNDTNFEIPDDLLMEYPVYLANLHKKGYDFDDFSIETYLKKLRLGKIQREVALENDPQNKKLNTSIKKIEDLLSIYTKKIIFSTTEHVLDKYQLCIDIASTKSNMILLHSLINQLFKAKQERLEILGIMKLSENINYDFINENGDTFDKKFITDSISKIDNLIAYGNEEVNEKQLSENKPINHPSITQTNKKTMNEKPIIEPEIFLPTPQPKPSQVPESVPSVHNEAITETIKETEEKINEFLKVIRANKVSKTSKGKMSKYIAVKKLDLGKLAAELKDFKDDTTIIALRNTSESLEKLQIELEQTVIKQRVTKVVEEQKPETPVVPLATILETSPIKTTEEYTHKSLRSKIAEFKTRLLFDKNGDKEKINHEVKDFILTHKEKIRLLIHAFDSAKVTDLVNSKYKSAKADLEGLEDLEKSLVENEKKIVEPILQPPIEELNNLSEEEAVDDSVENDGLDHLRQIRTEPETKPEPEKGEPVAEDEKEVETFTTYTEVVRAIANNNKHARTAFLNQHTAMVHDMQVEIDSRAKKGGAVAVNEFITRQQENINTLVALLIETRGENHEENSRLIITLQSDAKRLEIKRMEEK
ncbi:hypothetical protein H7Y21_04145, partial [Arenimonas sp.]|nr:hypothetical protein [Candidatus Parcubacteria bacterium]